MRISPTTWGQFLFSKEEAEIKTDKGSHGADFAVCLSSCVATKSNITKMNAMEMPKEDITEKVAELSKRLDYTRRIGTNK